MEHLVARLEPFARQRWINGMLAVDNVGIRDGERVDRLRGARTKRALVETLLRLDVVGIGLDLVDNRRVDQPDLDSSVEAIDEEAHEDFTIQAEFGADIVDAALHVVVGIAPEGVEEFLYFRTARRNGHALTEYKAGGDLYDREGQWIRVICLVTLVMQLQVGRGDDIF